MLPQIFETLERRTLFTAALAADLSADGAHPHDFVAFGGGTAFAGHSNATGNELWTTNGTPAGTRMMFDLAAGAASSNATPVAALGKTLLFTATVGKHTGLWATDGPARTTQLIAKGDPTAFGEFTALNGAILFAIHDRSGKAALMRTDGTSAGTEVIESGLTAHAGKIDLTAAGKAVFFFDGDTTRTLYRTDGTARGTRSIAGYTGQPGQAIGGSYVAMLATRTSSGLYSVAAGQVTAKLIQPFHSLTMLRSDATGPAYFIASTKKGAPQQAYRYDGRSLTQLTAYTTESLAGATGNGVGGSLYLAVGTTLYGVSARGTMLAALATLPADSKGRTGAIDQIVGTSDGALYARRLIAGHGELLQLVHGSLRSIGSVDMGVTAIKDFGVTVYFARPDATGENELFGLTSRSATATQLTDLNGGAESSGIRGSAALASGAVTLTTRVVSQNAAAQTSLTRSTIFAVHTGQPVTALWTIDSATDAAALDANTVCDAGGTAFFTIARTTSGDPASSTADLYRTDGTTVGTKLVMANVGLATTYLGRAGAYAFFSQGGGTTLAVPLAGSSSGFIAMTGRPTIAVPVVVGTKLYVQSASNIVLEFNGATGVGRVITLTSHLPAGVTLGHLAAWNAKLLLILTDGGDERVSTLNTSTLAVTQIAQYTRFNSGSITDVPYVDNATNTLWLADDYQWDGSRLVKIDLTQGTAADPAPLFANSAATLLGKLNGKLVVRSGGGGVYLSDGVHAPVLMAGTADATATLLTPQGLYIETAGGIYLNDGAHLTAVAGKGTSLAGAAHDGDGRLYFTAADAAHGVELWSYLHQPARIHGNIFADANGNGVQDGNETGLAGWRVFVDLNGDGAYEKNEPSVFTAANGSYALDDLADGRYLLTVDTPTDYTATTTAAYSVRLTPGGAAARYFGMQV